MEQVKVLKISELLQISSPLTGAAAFELSNESRKRDSGPIYRKKRKFRSRNDYSIFMPSDQSNLTDTDRGPKYRVLSSLKFRSVITGTISLASEYFTCPMKNCLSFSDGESKICCTVLSLDLDVIDKRIHVVGWNFIPLKCGGGVLEIIKWTHQETSVDVVKKLDCYSLPSHQNLSSLPQYDRSSKYSSIHGMLEAVSPILVVSCKNQSNNMHKTENDCSVFGASTGFIAKIIICGCRQCENQSSPSHLCDALKGSTSHSLTNSVFCFFCGPTSTWHPVVSGLVGNAVSLTGLKKKKVFEGNDGSYLILVTTGKTELSTPRSWSEWIPIGGTRVLERAGNDNYAGLVTGIYLRGMLVEMDKRVFLLLADRFLSPPHFLRVGSVILLRSIHFINPKFLWTKMILLGACSKTNISIKSFSPLATESHFKSSCQTLLGKFLESLTFTAKFWVLIITSCFRIKFAGRLTQKAIFGSRNAEGFAQVYARSNLPSSAYRYPMQGMFRQFHNHDHFGCGDEPNLEQLKLAIPNSLFVQHCDVMWKVSLPHMHNHPEQRWKRNTSFLLPCSRKPSYSFVRRIISSKNLGFVLVGSLKIHSSSRRLQLVDATGAIDVVVPDLLPSVSANDILEVKEYKLVMEGLSEQVNPSDILINEEFSCRSIFCPDIYSKVPKETTMYLHFHFRDSTCLSRSPSSSLVPNFIDRTRGGRFHLLLITHKFPILHHDDSNISNQSTSFAEAIILPYNLLFHGILHKGGVVQSRHSNSFRAALETASRQADTQHILLCFDQQTFNKYQSLRIGQYCAMKYGDISCHVVGHPESANYKKIIITPENSVWSVTFYPDENAHLKESQEDIVMKIYSSQNEELPFEVISPTEISFMGQMSFADVHLYLSAKEIMLLNEETVGLVQTFQVANYMESAMACAIHTPESAPRELNLPVGNLVNLCGKIVYVHNASNVPISNCAHCSFDVMHSIKQFWISPNKECASICIHVCDGIHTVKIRGSFNGQVYPIGMGPGANATFHRILLTCESSSQHEFMLIPASLVVINSVKEVICHYDSQEDILPIPDTQNEDLLDAVSPSFISQVVQRNDTRVRVCSRVAAVYILILENHQCNQERFRPMIQEHNNLASFIHAAGFILDDGSSSCCCWADSDRASILLGLCETMAGSPRTIHMSSNESSSIILKRNMRHLKRILSKHKRVTVKNYGAMLDPACADFTFCVPLNNGLSTFDEYLLNLIIFNACCGSVLSITGTIMDSNAVGCLEGLLEAQVTTHSVQNIWATEVEYVNPVDEARKILQELSEVEPMHTDK